MIAIAAALTALLLMCWILFTLAVYALPFFVAASAGMFAYQTGAGAFGAALVGLLAGIVALVLGQTLLAIVRSPVLRAALAIIYAAPAAFAGYHAVHGLAAMGSPSAPWHELLSIVGALIIGLVAWGRMGALAAGGPVGASLSSDAGGAVQAITKG
jgi:fermentation-respiration switch protein FrsA (DUF1100 family)